MSFAPLIARWLRALDRMPARSSVVLACKLVVESAGRTTTVIDWRRVVVVADRCIAEDKVDHCSSEILHSA